MVKINCENCISGNHNECLTSECSCAEDDHGKNYICDDCKKTGTFEDVHRKCETQWLSDGKQTSCTCPNIGHARNNNREFAAPTERSDEQRLWQLENEGTGNDSPEYVLPEMVRLVIFAENMVSKIEIQNRLKPFCKRHHIELDKIDLAIDIVWSDLDTYQEILKTASKIGAANIKTSFDRTQLAETANWITASNHIKRIELDGEMLYFNGKYYEGKAQALIERQATLLIVKSKNSDINEVVKHIERTCELITWDQIETSSHMKCLNNGLYDVERGVFSPDFDPQYIILHQIPQDYNESNTFEKIDEKVTELIPDDTSRQAYYDFLSSCLIPYSGIDYMLGLVGQTGSGKSQLTELAIKLFGDDNVFSAKFQILAKDQTTQKDAAKKMLNIDDDVSNESVHQIDTIKKWVTQSRMTGRSIYAQAATYRPMSRIMFAANDLFEIPNPDDAEAIYDRSYLIRIDKKFRRQSNEIKNVMDKVGSDEQLSGLITYLLKNAKWMLDNQSYHHTINTKDVENIWNTFGNKVQIFVKKWIVFDPRARTESGEPFNQWSNYAHENGIKPGVRKKFKEIFEEIVGNVPTKTRINNIECYAYSGFRMKTEEEIKTDNQTTLDSSNSSTNSTLYLISKIIQNKLQEKKVEL